MSRQWDEAHPEKMKATHAAWRARNRHKLRARNTAYRAAHLERERERIREWGQSNKPAGAAKSARRRAEVIKATPSWANQKYIALWYQHAAQEANRTGRRCHVDHIVPLRSPLVCGLHNEFNMQVMFGRENEAKGNRFWPDGPFEG